MCNRFLSLMSGVACVMTAFSLCVHAAAPVLSGDERKEGYVQAHTLKTFTKEYPFLDGQWEGIISASDGRIYFCVSSHYKERAAHIFRYDPEKRQMELLADVGEITKENGKGLSPQGKVHSEMHEDDGVIYFTTCWGNQDLKYPGGHWISYDLKSGKFTDHGIPLPGWGLVTMTYNPLYKRCYALACEYPKGDTGSRLLVMDVKTGKVTDKGLVQTGGHTCRVMFVDDKGKVYWSVPPGQIGVYDPEPDKIRFLKTSLPDPKDGEVSPKNYRTVSGRDLWRWIIWDHRKKTAYGLLSSNCHLFSFDPADGEGGKITDLGYIGAKLTSHDFPTNLGYTLGQNRRIYYTAWGSKRDTNLISYDLQSAQYIDHGVIAVEEGLKVVEVHSLVMGKDHKLYMVAFVHSIDSQHEVPEDRPKMGGQAYEMRFIMTDSEKDVVAKKEIIE